MEIRDGRLHVRPFRVGVGNVRMSVEGSNGVDQSLDYALGLSLPRASLGDATTRIVEGLASRAGRVGIDLQSADTLRVTVRATGTVTDPALDLGFGQAVAGARQQLTGAVGAAAESRVTEARETVDSAKLEARRRARERADSIVAEAERRAQAIRTEADSLAEQVRLEGNRRADEVLAKATNPVARRAAQPVADRIRKEAEDRADQIVREAGERADTLVAEARKRADALVGEAGDG
jgi:vacuolar-type H+-ATPase subunit H